jgi:hypothetical protein
MKYFVAMTIDETIAIRNVQFVWGNRGKIYKVESILESRKIRFFENVARMREARNAYKILVGKRGREETASET